MLTRLVVVVVSLSVVGCGGHFATGPSTVPAPAVAGEGSPPPAALAASSLPTSFDAGAIARLGLDPEYVRVLVYTYESPEGPVLRSLERWSGGIMRHCVAGLDVDQVAGIAEMVAAATGIPYVIATSDCTVRWVNEGGPGCGFHPCAARASDGRSVTLYFPDAGRVPDSGLHEMGHALGLGHSPRRDDVMCASDFGARPRAFSGRELAVLAAVYPSTK